MLPSHLSCAHPARAGGKIDADGVGMAVLGDGGYASGPPSSPVGMAQRLLLRRLMRCVGRYALVALVCAVPWPTAVLAFPALDVYRDAVAAGWQDWSWGGVTRDFARSSPVHAGTASIAVTYTAGWSGLQLGRNDPVDTTGFDVLRCWVHGGAGGGQQVQIEVGNHLIGVSTRAAVTPPAGAWTSVDVPLAALGTTQITYMYWFNNTAGPQATFYVDDVVFTASGNPTPTPPGPVPGPALRIDAGAGRHAINPDVYGMNFADEALAAELRLPVRRWGGNATTRYNWQTDTSNHASDWYFENIPNDNPNPAALPDGSSSDQFVEQDRRTGTASLLTIPLIGWTPHGRAYACGFSVALYGAQQSTDPWRPDCGNGVGTSGAAITGNNPRDTSDPIAPTFVQDWMRHLMARYGTAASGGVQFYDLDNEPMLWAETHRDVHPQPPGYDELRDRTLAYAAAVKAVDPDALTLGPAEWGWTGYFWSALDAAPGGAWWNNPQDRLAHGNLPLVEWYLQQLRAYEQQHAVRILDYLDLHYYPQAAGVALAPAGDAATQALRLRTTRSLWDPAYTDESWIGDTVRLIPRMRDWVAGDYPGTRLAISEYNWGALDHINGALAEADVLGIFGREGLDLATLWAPPASSQPGAYAFRMYRNVDGAGTAFGDTAVSASSTDQGTVAVYAAQRGGAGALTVLIINKADTPQTSALTLAGFVPGAAATAYLYSAANLSAIVRLPDQPVSATGFTTTFPAASLTLFVIAPAAAPVVTPTPTPSATARPFTATAAATATATATRAASATPSRTAAPPVPTPSGTPTVTPVLAITSTPTVAHRVSGAIRYYRGGGPVPGVVVELQGTPPLTATSGSDGQYVAGGVPDGAWRIAPRKTGDRRGGLSALDAAYVLQAVAGTRTLTPEQMLAGDVTGDGTLSALDATRILQFVVGALPQLPAAQLCGSDWLFVPAATAPGASLLLPAIGAGTCERGAIVLGGLTSDAAGQDFQAVLIGDVSGNWR